MQIDPHGDQQEPTPSLRTARSADLLRRALPVRSAAAGWGIRNLSPTPQTHLGHRIGGGRTKHSLETAALNGPDLSICAG